MPIQTDAKYLLKSKTSVHMVEFKSQIRICMMVLEYHWGPRVVALMLQPSERVFS